MRKHSISCVDGSMVYLSEALFVWEACERSQTIETVQSFGSFERAPVEDAGSNHQSFKQPKVGLQMHMLNLVEKLECRTPSAQREIEAG